MPEPHPGYRGDGSFVLAKHGSRRRDTSQRLLPQLPRQGDDNGVATQKTPRKPVRIQKNAVFPTMNSSRSGEGNASQPRETGQPSPSDTFERVSHDRPPDPPTRLGMQHPASTSPHPRDFDLNRLSEEMRDEALQEYADARRDVPSPSSARILSPPAEASRRPGVSPLDRCAPEASDKASRQHDDPSKRAGDPHRFDPVIPAAGHPSASSSSPFAGLAPPAQEQPQIRSPLDRDSGKRQGLRARRSEKKNEFVKFRTSHAECSISEAVKLFNRENGTNLKISLGDRWATNAAKKEAKKETKAAFMEYWRANSQSSVYKLVRLFNEEKDAKLHRSRAELWVKAQKAKEERQQPPLPNRETASSGEESHPEGAPEPRR